MDLKENKILVCIPTIDEDIHFFEFQYNNILDSLDNIFNYDILVVTREQDIISKKKWESVGAKVVIIPSYSLFQRHNLENLTIKRNICLEYAKINDYKAIFFIDSDILINRKIAIALKSCSLEADIVVVPYEHIITKQNTVAVETPTGRKLIDARLLTDIVPSNILGGGAGCTYISKKAYGIRFEIKYFNSMVGEDIGFFNNCTSDLIIKSLPFPNFALHIYEKSKKRGV